MKRSLVFTLNFRNSLSKPPSIRHSPTAVHRHSFDRRRMEIPGSVMHARVFCTL